MQMDYETLITIQGYVKIFLIIITFIIFYSWVYSMYKNEKNGEKDYEKYSNLVLDDKIDSKVLEPRDENSDKKEKTI